MRRLLILILAVILYGSLFPLRFENAGTVGDAVHALLTGWPAHVGRGDAVANVLLYIPLGFALTALFLRRTNRLAAALAAAVLATLIGAALSFAVETTQFFIPRRTVSLSDFAFNGAGTALGAMLALLSRFSGTRPTPPIADAFALLLAVAWLADRLWPLVPALDMDNLKQALKPLLFAFEISSLAIVRLALGWILFGTLMDGAFGRGRRTGFIVAALALGAAFAPPFLLGRILTADGIFGAVLGLAAWIALRPAPPRLARALPLLAALALVAIVGLAPYTVLPSARPFTFIPFADFIGSVPAAAAQAMVLKSFLAGALVWAMARAGLAVRAVAILAPAVFLAVSAAQMWLPGRSAAITDAVIALAMVFALAALRTPVK
jgi:VanZ family protein